MQKIKDKIRLWTLVSLLFIFILNFICFIIYDLDNIIKIIILFLDFLFLSFGIFICINPHFILKNKKELLLLSFSLLIFFLFFEICLRVTSCEFGKYDFFQAEQGEIQYKHMLDTKICNRVKGDGATFRVISNNEGFIDSDFIKNSSQRNIFLLGDSFAQCLQSKYENCVHKKLETDLKKIYGEDINVLNFGVSRYGILDHLAILNAYKEDYKPKLVIVYFLPQNDLLDIERYRNYKYDENYKRKQFLKKIMPKSIQFFTKGIKSLVELFLSGSENYKLNLYSNQITRYYDVYLNNYSQEWEGLMNSELDSLLEMKEICDESGSTLLVVTVTSIEQVYEEDWQRILETYPYLQGKEYNLSKPNIIVKNFLDKHNIYNLDLLPIFKENPDNLHWKYDGHWNDNGQLLAEEEIRKFIIENNLLNDGK